MHNLQLMRTLNVDQLGEARRYQPWSLTGRSNQSVSRPGRQARMRSMQTCIIVRYAAYGRGKRQRRRSNTVTLITILTSSAHERERLSHPRVHFHRRPPARRSRSTKTEPEQLVRVPSLHFAARLEATASFSKHLAIPI